MVGVALFLQSKDFASFIAVIGDRQHRVDSGSYVEGQKIHESREAKTGALRRCLMAP